jgi:hypothetical protein
MSEVFIFRQASAVYRTGPLAIADYDDAIKDLLSARAQLLSSQSGEVQPGCSVCSDTDHTAEVCHHNPLAMGRWAAEAGLHLRRSHPGSGPPWTCFHCDQVCWTEAEAVEHFGRDRFTAPACRIHTDDDTRIPGLSDLVCEEVPEPLRCMRCGEDAAFNADPAGPLCALCVLIDYDEQSGQEPLSDADLAATLAQLEAGSICCICMEPLEGGPGFLRMCATCGTMPAEPPTTAEGEDHA